MSIVKRFDEGPDIRVTSQLDKRNLSSWLVKIHLFPKHKCRTLTWPLFSDLAAAWGPWRFVAFDFDFVRPRWDLPMYLPRVVLARPNEIQIEGPAPTRPTNLKSAVTHVQILLHYSILVQTNVSLLQSFHDQHARWQPTYIVNCFTRQQGRPQN